MCCNSQYNVIQYAQEDINMKDCTVSARVEADVKNRAEMILDELGIPVSVLINSLYRQIIYTKGIPFSLNIKTQPKTLDEMSDEEFAEKLQKGYEDSLNGDVIDIDDAFDIVMKPFKK